MNVSRRRVLQASLAASAVAALPALPSGPAAAAPPHARFERAEHEPDLSLGTRPRVAEVPSLFAEFQYKYNLYENMLTDFIDRPLFNDPSIRPATATYNTAESYFRDIAIARTYGFDGTGSLAVPSIALWDQVNGYLQAEPDRAPGHHEYPQFAFAGFTAFSTTDRHYVQARSVLQTALASPFSPRIAGRIPIATYNSGYVKLDVMEQFLTALRDEFGDTFAVVGQLVIDWADQVAYEADGGWSAAVRQKYADRIADLLAVYDGIQLEMPWPVWRLDYRSEAEFGAYDDHLSELVVEALARPENAGKLLCGQVRQGYENHFTMVTHGEFGTGRMRETLDRLVKLNPDMVFFFEWNEFNENTMIQPSVRNSLALQRLIKYYASIFTGTDPEPNEGDDITVPPLVLTHREEVKVGEKLEFELLNVPDTTTAASYTARLVLHDLSGRVVRDFGTETFDRARLRAVTFTVPSEWVSDLSVLVPRLTVTDSSGAPLEHHDLQHVRILPTTSSNYTTTRQSLRDILRPTSMSFDVTATADGRYRLVGEVTADEPLATLEVTDHGREFHAADPTGTYDLVDTVLIKGAPSSRSSRWENIRVEVTGAPGWEFHADRALYVKAIQRTGDVVTASAYVWLNRTAWFITVPEDRSPDARVSLTIGTEAHDFALADLVELGAHAQLFADGTGRDARCDWTVHRRQPDTPVHLGTPSAEIDVTLASAHTHPVFQLRAITVSGKIVRSAPIMPSRPVRSEPVPVISESTGAVVRAMVPRDSVPRLGYRLDEPRAGAALLAPANRPQHHAQLGGGLIYDEPFYVPTPVTGGFSHVPTWVTEDGRPALSFHTEQSWANFPIDTFPRGAFTLTMDVKPTLVDQRYVLFRHFSSILGSITLYVDTDGELVLGFGDKQTNTHVFRSGLVVPAMVWSTIRLSYDLRAFEFVVGTTRQTVQTPTPLQALYAKPAVFGGHVKVEFGLPAGAAYFQGFLGRLQIDHTAGTVRR
ncbi:hypothetical protein ACQBAU_11605 [Propionibacteriaceae bacterium Y2011]|uniref:hypothetical protein n=1 Tax=Microlunatus sp. Y2014 TaxID=3418488 RepID=UPI003B4B8FF0